MKMLFVRYLAINLCAVLLFKRSSNTHISKINKYAIFSTLLLELVISVVAALPANIFQILAPIYLPLLLFVFCFFIFRQQLTFTLINSLVSYAISYVFYTVTFFIYTIVTFLIGKGIGKPQIAEPSFALQCLVSPLFLLLCYLFFKIKRFRSGINLYPLTRQSIALLCFSIAFLISYVLFKLSSLNIFGAIVVIFVIILATLFAFIWKSLISSSYHDKLVTRQIESMQNEISQLSDKLKEYENDIHVMSAQIHSDNKLIPAAINTVKDFISSTNNKRDTNDVINYLDSFIKNRAKIIGQTVAKGTRNNVQTGNIFIDSITNFMIKVGGEKSVDIEIKGAELFSSDLIPISAEALSSVLADLIENSIHACKDTISKRVFIEFDIKDGILSISVSDTGEQFSLNMFNKMGVMRYTTRKKDGGSGIGLMNIFDNIRASNASFTLFEYTNEGDYTKKITISFDGLSEYKIYSNRKSQIRRRMTRFDFKLYDYDDLNLQVSNT